MSRASTLAKAVGSNGQFQMRNNVGTNPFVPVINLITLR